MSDAPPHVKTRFSVDVEHEPESLLAQIGALARIRPSGHIVLLKPCGFAYRREPDVFAAIASGASLGMAIMLTELTFRLTYFTLVGRVAGGFFVLCSVALFTRFVVNSASAWEVTSDGRMLRSRRTLGGRTRRKIEIDTDGITSVFVVSDDKRPHPRVVLGGPRHEQLAELYELRMLDPDRLAPFLAEMVSLVARHASAKAVTERKSGS